MFKYVVALLLINTFYCSFGYPVNETYVSIGKSLQLLANNCDDNFLSTQILKKYNACNISLTSEGEITESELECLIFYDINTQLCTTLRGSKLNTSKSFESTMSQAPKVDVTCGLALKNWKFSNLTEYPNYYNTSRKVFKTSVTCLKACGVKSLYSEDTNFFCKYYQWGSEILQATYTAQASNVVSGESGAGTITIANVSTSSSSILPKSNDNAKDSQPQVESPSLPANENLENVSSTKQTQSDQHHTNVAEADVSKKKTAAVKNDGNIKDTNGNIKDTHENIKDTHPNDLSVQSNPGKSPYNPEENLQSDNFNDDLGEDGNELDTPDVVLPHEGNDEDDPHLEPEKTQKQKNGAPILSSNGERDMYSNTIPSHFLDDDDHFFSFFLTAIILVIFLYILYHNKSKCRKVFLGLLVEGRQPGRRRNSRGHEYRRLDTLEQAMSANSTAPPSKIIY